MARLGLIPLGKEISQLEQAYGILEKKIFDVLFSITPSDYTDLKAMKATDKISLLIKNMNLFVLGWIRRNINKSYKIAEEVNESTFKKDDIQEDPNAPASRKELTIAGMVDITFADYLKANQSIKENANGYLQLMKLSSNEVLKLQEFDVQNVAEDILKGVNLSSGVSRNQASRQILSNLKKLYGDSGFVVVKGRRYKAKYYAELVARTRLRETQTNSTIDTNIRFGNDLVQVSRHEHISDICSPFEGKVFSISGHSSIYPQLSEAPPFHPNCQHVLLPFVDTGSQFRRRNLI